MMEEQMNQTAGSNFGTSFKARTSMNNKVNALR